MRALLSSQKELTFLIRQPPRIIAAATATCHRFVHNASEAAAMLVAMVLTHRFNVPPPVCIPANISANVSANISANISVASDQRVARRRDTLS